jgi:hypothetical protein
MILPNCKECKNFNKLTKTCKLHKKRTFGEYCNDFKPRNFNKNKHDCEFCHKSFQSYKHYERHLKSYHGIKDPSKYINKR